MDDDDALVGGSDDEESCKWAPAQDDEEGDGEEEPDGMVEEEGDEEEEEEEEEEVVEEMSECTVEYNRQHSQVPEKCVKRDHQRYHVVPTVERLSEMKSSHTTPAKWPAAEQIDPAAIVVLEGRIKEEDESQHFVWYLRAVVEGREDESDDKNSLLHMPRGTTKEMLQIMAKDEDLCESHLISDWMPTNYNEQRILPKLNGWPLLSKAPKTLAIKKQASKVSGKKKPLEEGEAPDKSKQPNVAEAAAPAVGTATTATDAAPPVKKQKAVEATPPKALAKTAKRKRDEAPAAPSKKAAAAPKAAAKPAPKGPFEKAKSSKEAATTASTAPKSAAPAAAPERVEIAPAPAPAPEPALELPLPVVMERVPTYDPTDRPSANNARAVQPVVKPQRVEHNYSLSAEGMSDLNMFTPPVGATQAEITVVYKFD
tara:strand:- start:10837 stop:12117 length:1281 start_codon:yes stop_codon:yes gene_type:complete